MCLKHVLNVLTLFTRHRLEKDHLTPSLSKLHLDHPRPAAPGHQQLSRWPVAGVHRDFMATWLILVHDWYWSMVNTGWLLVGWLPLLVYSWKTDCHVTTINVSHSHSLMAESLQSIDPWRMGWEREERAIKVWAQWVCPAGNVFRFMANGYFTLKIVFPYHSRVV